MDPSNDPKPGEVPGKNPAKKPYESPRILFRERLEALAAACTDTDAKPDGVSCVGPPQS